MTTSTLRPDATISAGGATFTGGAGNWHGNTSDDSDASYATLAVGGVATLGITTVSLPAGNVTKQFRVRARVRADTTTSVPNVGVYLNGVRIAGVSPGIIGTTITTFTGAYFPASMSQTDLDSLQLIVDLAPTSAGSCRFLELYVDAVHAAQPTVAIVSPTGTVVVSTFPVNWTYTQGSDGGPQTYLHYKVFDDATFDGGGFNPNTSTAVYDSGVIASSTPAVLVGPVVDGTDHHQHVRAAQTINGVPHWSAWDEQIFTVNAPSPEVSTVTPVAVGSAIQVTVARNTGAASWTAVTVQRSFDSGTTWEFVRGATRGTASGNSFVVTDYEAPNGRSVLYRAQAHDASTTGAWVQAASAVSWLSSAIWLKSVSNPTRNRPVLLQAISGYTLAEMQQQQLALQTETAADAATLETLLGPPRTIRPLRVIGRANPVTVQDAGDILLVQYPATYGIDDRYLAVIGYSQGFIAGPGQQTVQNIGLRTFAVDVVEVDRPADTTSV